MIVHMQLFKFGRVKKIDFRYIYSAKDNIRPHIINQTDLSIRCPQYTVHSER